MSAAKAAAKSARPKAAVRPTRQNGSAAAAQTRKTEDAGDKAANGLEGLGSEVHSISAREPLRSRLADDVEAFLAGGGSIEEVPKDFRADPPKRPQSTYGRGSI